MNPMYRLLWAELLKLKQGAVLRVVILLPILFALMDVVFFRKSLLGMSSHQLGAAGTVFQSTVKGFAGFWMGFFHPLMMVLVPALVFWPEHRSGLWKHLHAQGTGRLALHGAKVLIIFGLLAAGTALAVLCHFLEWRVLAKLNPILAYGYPWRICLSMAAWSLLGSLPLMALYIWMADRVANLAVPMVFGLIGCILTLGLSGAEVMPSWRRDFIPWLLPFVSAQQGLPASARADTHMAAQVFRYDPNVVVSPSGKRYKVISSTPESELFPPPPPTSPRALAWFGVLAGALLLGLGCWDAGRRRG